jgi:hypothetical protein
MGSNNSVNEQRQREANTYAIFEQRALQLFTQRVNNYHYAFHGPYENYIHDIRLQYELDCLPDSVRYGNNYRQRN